MPRLMSIHGGTTDITRDASIPVDLIPADPPVTLSPINGPVTYTFAFPASTPANAVPVSIHVGVFRAGIVPPVDPIELLATATANGMTVLPTDTSVPFTVLVTIPTSALFAGSDTSATVTFVPVLEFAV